MEGVVNGVMQTMDLPIAMKPIVEEAAATEQQVLEVGNQVEMQLCGLQLQTSPIGASIAAGKR